MNLLAATLLLTTTAAAQPAPDPTALTEDATPLQVEIGGQPYTLDALTIRRPGTDRLPVALITHGANTGDERGATMEWLRGWALDLAHRGWLAVAVMRRGYGHSDGAPMTDAGTCESPDLGRYLNAQADDLQAALHITLHRPDADGTRVIAIGDSAGGAAVLALAARIPAQVQAVINVSGGVGQRDSPFHPRARCDAYYSDLVWNFAQFGTTAHMPTLWLYAENDGWFRPGLVSRMRAAFTGSGGKADLVMLPPFGGDGHAMFFAPNGPNLLLPELDTFLRANALPTWDEAEFAPVLAWLPPEVRPGALYYARTGNSERALALGQDGQVYWWEGAKTADIARDRALAVCRKTTGSECRLLAVGTHPVTP